MLLLDEIAARRWLTPYRADALTLEAVASGQLSGISGLRDHWQLITGLQLSTLHDCYRQRRLVLFCNGSRNVNDRQQHEDIGL